MQIFLWWQIASEARRKFLPSPCEFLPPPCKGVASFTGGCQQLINPQTYKHRATILKVNRS